MSDPIKKFENPKRLEEINIEKTLGKVEIDDHAVICDYGSGTGIFTLAMAKKTKGTVYALDMSSDMLKLVEEKASNNDMKNIETIQVEADALPLESESVNLLVMITVLHEINDIPVFIKEIKRVLKLGGKVLIIDFQRKEASYGPPIHEKISAYQAARYFLKEDILLEVQENLGENLYMLVASR